MRINDEIRRVRLPELFIDGEGNDAEEVGKIVVAGRWMLRRKCSGFIKKLTGEESGWVGRVI
ncbi:hypothetical protein Hanom_Chr08g00741511 [Helianthus anomalus]